MQQQFISQPAPYPVTSPLGVQSVIPQAQSVVPQIGAPAIYQAQSVAIPQVQSVVPQVVPQVQSVVPQVQSVVPQVVPQVQSVVPQVVPQVIPYVQPIGSRHPIEQNHLGLGLNPGSFST